MSIIENGTQLELELKKLKRNPLNTYEMQELDDLKSSIMTYGLITPISVIGPDEDGTYMLIAGERRLHTFEELYAAGDKKYKKMPVYVIGPIDMSETEQKLLIESSNLDTRDGFDKQVHYLNVIKLLKAYKEENNLNLSEYIKMREQYLKCSPRYARFYEAIFNKGTDDLISMVEKGEVSVSRGGRIASMPKHIQESAVKDLRAGMNQDEVVNKHSKMQKMESEGYMTDLDEDFDSYADLEETLDSDKELDNEMDFDDSDFDDFDFNTMSTDCLNMGGTSYSDSNSSSELKTIKKWCEKIINKGEPSDAEWEVIEACKKVAEVFA